MKRCAYCNRELVPEDPDFPDTSLKVCVKCLIQTLRRAKLDRGDDPIYVDDIRFEDTRSFIGTLEDACRWTPGALARLRDEVDDLERELEYEREDNSELHARLTILEDYLKDFDKAVKDKAEERAEHLTRLLKEERDASVKVSEAAKESERAAIELVGVYERRNRMWPDDDRVERIQREKDANRKARMASSTLENVRMGRDDYPF
jgi:chromosome segregation ATPase